MAANVLEAYFIPSLVPTIMSISATKQSIDYSPRLLYITITLGTILSTTCGLLHFHLNRYLRSRVYLTILTAALFTFYSLISIVGFHITRKSIDYNLPVSIRGQLISNSSLVFRYHFFADFIPGFIIFSQILLYLVINRYLLFEAKRNFSLGEASIFVQLISASYLTWALTTYSKITGAGPFTVSLTTDILLNIGFIIFSFILVPCYLLVKGKGTLIRYTLIVLGLSVCFARVQALISETSSLDPPTWLIGYILESRQRVDLFMLWLLTVTGCVTFSTVWSKLLGQTNSFVRKVFHVAICVVFMSGFNQDFEFTKFAAGGMVIIMLFVEMIRAWQLEPFGERLENVCRTLRGGWDNQHLTLSHIYLLVGAFIPFWLIPVRPETDFNKLLLSSGLIALGVGDTSAAIIGGLFGRTTLHKNSKKTIEGMLANMIAMLLFKLYWIGYTGFLNEYSFALAAISTSLTEAITKSCDNLILPLVMIIFLEMF